MVECRRTPCHNCPFRKDSEAISLRPGRLLEIVASIILRRKPFYCHKTTGLWEELTDADGNEYRAASRLEKECMGAIAFTHKVHRMQTDNTETNIALGKLTVKQINIAAGYIITKIEDAKTCE